MPKKHLSGLDSDKAQLTSMLADEATRIDISDPLKEIAQRLNATYNDIAKIVMRPGEVQIELFKRNDNGSIYIDLETKQSATYTRTFRVTT